MELRFRTAPLDDGTIRVDTITNPQPNVQSTWEKFGTFKSLAEAATACGEEVALQHRRAHGQTYRVEIRFDVTGTEADARTAAVRAASETGGEVTAIFDESFEELDQ